MFFTDSDPSLVRILGQVVAPGGMPGARVPLGGSFTDIALLLEFADARTRPAMPLSWGSCGGSPGHGTARAELWPEAALAGAWGR